MASRRTRQAAPAPEVEIEQVDTGGLGVDEGIVLATFFLLIGAIALVWIASESYVI